MAAFRSMPADEPGILISLAPRSTKASSRARLVPSRSRNQVGTSAAVVSRREVSGVRRWLSAMTRTFGVGRKPGMRQVRSGLSASTVPTPTMTASWRPRMAWARRRAGVPVIHWLSPPWVAMRPSSVEASFSVTIGRPRVTRWLKPIRVSQGLGFQQAGFDCDAGGPELLRVPWPLTRGSGSGGGDDDTGDAGGDQRVGAGRGAAVVAAGFQRDVGGGALGLRRRPSPGRRVRRAGGRRAGWCRGRPRGCRGR